MSFNERIAAEAEAIRRLIERGCAQPDSQGSGCSFRRNANYVPDACHRVRRRGFDPGSHQYAGT